MMASENKTPCESVALAGCGGDHLISPARGQALKILNGGGGGDPGPEPLIRDYKSIGLCIQELGQRLPNLPSLARVSTS